MGRSKAKAIKHSIRAAAWDELNESDGGKGYRLVVPNVILNHPNYRRLSFAGKAVVWDIAAEYTGHNNGYLSATRNEMIERNWPSPATLQRAINEAIHYGILFQTQQGGRNKVPNLYAITWRKVNHRDKQPLHMVPEWAYAKPLSTWKEPREPLNAPVRKTAHEPRNARLKVAA